MINLIIMSIITSFKTVNEFGELMTNNPGKIIIKFGADWCGPCKIIEQTVHEWFDKAPATIQCCNLDVDTNFELFGFLKRKKIVKGVPVLLCYDKNNEDGYPDDFVSGGDIEKTNQFFQRCFHSRI